MVKATASVTSSRLGGPLEARAKSSAAEQLLTAQPLYLAPYFYVCVCVSLPLCVCMSVSVRLCLSFSVSLCLSLCLSVVLPVSLFVYLSISPSISLSTVYYTR